MRMPCTCLPKPVFVPGSEKPSDILSILKPENMEAPRERVWHFLTSFILSSSEDGMYIAICVAFVVIDYSTYSPVLLDFVQFATGCPVITGNCIKVTFSGDTAADAVVSHTCSKEL